MRTTDGVGWGRPLIDGIAHEGQDCVLVNCGRRLVKEVYNERLASQLSLVRSTCARQGGSILGSQYDGHL